MTKEECEIETSKAIMEMRNHIAELEKENNKLESRNDKLVKMYNEVVERQNSFQQSLCKNLSDLEKENEEAKKQIRNLLYVYQLQKNGLATARITAEAEQFLKED